MPVTLRHLKKNVIFSPKIKSLTLIVPVQKQEKILVAFGSLRAAPRGKAKLAGFGRTIPD
jgi:hypothetical protein